MQKIKFDNGVEKFEINGKDILQFNPSDPNVYQRFLQTVDSIVELEAQMESKMQEISGESANNGEAVIKLLHEIDLEIKAKLKYTFGAENDFDKILNGVNFFSVGENGERVITNFFAALEPIISKGAKAQLSNKASDALANREQRRAASKKGLLRVAKK